jgi:hypothetical protein
VGGRKGLAEERQRAELAECTFKPALVAKPKASPHVPLHKRLPDLMRKKSQKMAQMKADVSAAPPGLLLLCAGAPGTSEG